VMKRLPNSRICQPSLDITGTLSITPAKGRLF
jgi:hypothetical protein